MEFLPLFPLGRFKVQPEQVKARDRMRRMEIENLSFFIGPLKIKFHIVYEIIKKKLTIYEKNKKVFTFTL